MKAKIDQIWVGFIAGLVGTVVTFLLFGLGFSLFNNISFSSFWYDTFLGIQDFQSRIVTFSMVGNVVMFFLMIKREYYRFCKGLMIVMVVSVPVVVMLY